MEKSVIIEDFVFPSRQLPPCFSNINICEKLAEVFSEYNSVIDMLKENFNIEDGCIKEFTGYKDSVFGLKKGTEAIHVCVSKPNGGNRILSVVNPLILLPLHFYIYEHHDIILKEQEDNTNFFVSSSKYEFKEDKIIRYNDYEDNFYIENVSDLKQPGFKENLLIKHKVCDGKYYHLTIDISNFFNSIYTHTISWDLKDSSNKFVFDNMDILIRSMNCNETKGILIGPYTSSLVAELVLSKVDRKIKKKCCDNKVSYVRFCDDYDFFSDSKEKLENGIKLYVGEELSKYKLDFNMSKMKLEEFPFISLNTVQNKSIFLLKKRIEGKSYDDGFELVEDIMNEINNSIKMKYSNCNYLLKVLISLIEKNKIDSKYLNDDVLSILLDFLINMMFKNNMISLCACNLIIKIFSLSSLDRNGILDKWINKRNDRQSQLKEIIDIWLLYLILVLNVTTDLTDNFVLSIISQRELETILCFEYFSRHNKMNKYKKEIKEYLNNIKLELKNRFSCDWKNAGYFTKYWLLFYTNSIRWKIHDIVGFRDTILKDMYVDNIMADSTLAKKYNLFKIMFDKKVNFFSIDY